MFYKIGSIGIHFAFPDTCEGIAGALASMLSDVYMERASYEPIIHDPVHGNSQVPHEVSCKGHYFMVSRTDHGAFEILSETLRDSLPYRIILAIDDSFRAMRISGLSNFERVIFGAPEFLPGDERNGIASGKN